MVSTHSTHIHRNQLQFIIALKEIVNNIIIVNFINYNAEK